MINTFSDYFEKYGPLSQETKIAVERISAHISLPGNEMFSGQGIL